VRTGQPPILALELATAVHEKLLDACIVHTLARQQGCELEFRVLVQPQVVQLEVEKSSEARRFVQFRFETPPVDDPASIEAGGEPGILHA